MLGALPPFPVDTPYWQEAAEVVAGARQRYGLEVTILRLLAARLPQPPGGAVTYLAQAQTQPLAQARAQAHGRPETPLTPVTIDHTAHPARADYARPGGPALSLAWAGNELARLGLGPVRAAVQQRTWNLSAIWRLATGTGAIWLKQVPTFFQHESVVLGWLAEHAPGFGPPLLAADRQGRMLLANVDGADWYHATPTDRNLIAAAWHPIQVRSAAETAGLIAAGVPDRRAVALAVQLRAVVERHGDGVAGLDVVLDRLAERLAALARCGLPDTLVHGDLHPGNARVGATGRVVLDWGDSFVGHPGFDILRLSERLPDADARWLCAAWADRWRAAVPGCDPVAAIALLRPLAALRNAALYAHFLANIEPSEHPYHAADVPFWLAEAVRMANG